MTPTVKHAESPTVINTREMARDDSRRWVAYESQVGEFRLSIEVMGDSLWTISTWPRGGRALLRCAHAPGGVLELTAVETGESGVSLVLETASGRYDVEIELFEGDEPVIHSRTRLTPAANMTITTPGRDLLILGSKGSSKPALGSADISPSGLSASLLQLTLKGQGSLFYFQNLTSLTSYAHTTGVSLSGAVGGRWPEMGFLLPPSQPDKFLAAGESVVISDAFLRLSAHVPTTHLDLARQFLSNVGAVYPRLEHPGPTYRDWLSTSDAVLSDLDTCVGCWSFAAGKKYVNAYLSDYDTPPELMVQLAVLMPLLDYSDATGEEVPHVNDIRATLESFFDPELGVVRRWLPARDEDLDAAEEQKKPNVMDSWYVHHTLLNLGRMAQRGDKGAEKLFFDSIEYVIKVAHLFKYDWPVFFDIKTLEIIKAESKPGAGGQKDVPGIYAHVMLQAWDLTGDQRYLDEASRAGRALANQGFDIYYQANVTAFGALAMFRLWKITNKKRFLDACYLCVANMFANMWLWDCAYGFGREYKTFLTAIPVKDAPYIASYEEQEVCATFSTLLSESVDDELLPAVRLLLAEFVRQLVDSAWYSYPNHLPAGILPDRPKTGELSRDLWIPLEDIGDGWEKSGAVGQEVYGVGLAPGVVARHYHHVDGAEWTLYAESLIVGPELLSKSQLRFTVVGDPQIESRVRVLGEKRPRRLAVKAESDGEFENLPATETPEGHLEFVVRGGQTVTFDW